MAMITQEMKEMVKNLIPAMVATANKEGLPNVVAMGSVRVLDDNTLGLGVMTQGKTYQNLNENPVVAITVVDAKQMKQIQFKGKAILEKSGPFFEELKAEFDAFNVVPQYVVKIAVSEIYPFPPPA